MPFTFSHPAAIAPLARQGLVMSARAAGSLARLWSGEIASQPPWIVKETLRAMPGYGRTPLDLPQVPTLFIWGRTDLLGVAPRRPGPGEVILPGNHGLPMSAASRVAAALQPISPPPEEHAL